MARQGTPNGGLAEITERVYVNGADLTLVAYANAQDSLGPNTVAADLVQPTVAAGYAPITLNGVWATDNGVVTYTHPAGPSADAVGNPTWFASGAWSAPVTGVAVIFGSRVVHFMDHRDGGGSAISFTAAAGKRLTVDLSTFVA